MRKPKGQKSSRPDGWLMAGIKVPLDLTARQRKYAVRAVGIDRLCFNLAVETHRFHHNNRLPWPSASEIAKEFNAVERSGSPSSAMSQNSFLKELSATSKVPSPTGATRNWLRENHGGNARRRPAPDRSWQPQASSSTTDTGA